MNVLDGTMNQDSLSFTLTQISYLVSTLNKRNFAQQSRFLSQLVKQFGLEADRHLLRCLFSSINFGDAIQVSKNSLQAKLLSTELTALLNKSSLISNICFAIDNTFLHQKSLKPSTVLFTLISRSLNCSPIQEVAIALALQYSTNLDLARFAGIHIKNCLPNLVQSYIEIDTAVPNQEGSLNDISPELLQLILSLISHGKHSKFGLTDLVYNKFINQLCRDFPRDRVPLILAPLLYSEDIEISAEKMSSNSQGILTSAIMDTSWANLVMDIGYAFTASVDECKTHVMKVGGRDINAQDVAKIISFMCRTPTNLSDSSINLPTPGSFWPGSQGNTDPSNKDKSQTNQTPTSTSEHTTWKPEVFVQALREVAPSIVWKDVCLAFDHQEFIIKDRVGLQLLIKIIQLGMQSSGAGTNLPVECIYRHWNNAEGQLSLISIILKNSDLFSFADHIFTSVPVELLKTVPETDNRDVAAWKSLHLVDVLLYIAENNLYSPVLDLFKFPIQHCPDVLFMALLQINPPVTVLRQELFTTLIPIFLGNHPNSGPILHHAWTSNNFNQPLKHIIMHAMSEWYIRGDYDQTKLSRILDVAQDLKALSNLLNHRSFMFVIDLACLASRREYLKLEKWLSDKIREHGEQFVQATIKFLQRRCPQIMGSKIPEDQIPKASQLQHETVSTILSCLQACVGSVPQDIADIIITMTTNHNLLNKPRQQAPPGVLRHRGLDTPFNATNISGQMFTGSSLDTIPGITSNIAGLNIGSQSSGAFSFNNVLGNLVSPVSPSRIMATQSNSPFPMMSHPSSVPNNAVSNLTRMASSAPSGDKLSMTNTVFPDMAANVTKEVEDEANSYFQRIYNHPPHPTLSIDEVLDMLQRFQESPIQREREVYQCMLRNLFEEYRFFPQYPEKELQITAQLFGGMVERSLVTTYVALGLALRCVLDALRKSNGKMFYFGIAALDRFKTKLHQYQKYCEHVRNIPHFSEFPPHLIEFVEYGAQGQEPPKKPGQVVPSTLPQMMPASTPTTIYRSNSVTGNMVTTPTTTKALTNPTPQAALQTSRVKSIANATNIDTLLVANADREEKIITPPDTVQDKTAFIFNNLSQLNLTQKCEEIKEILTKDYFPWVSQYLVLKRASIEINFHALYSNFLDALKIPEINRLVTKETFRNIKVLLRSDKGIANFSDRTLLKNLGHWLGIMTLGRSRPILQIDIDLKSLLVEAYHKGQQELLYVVPFVSKVLESCSKSRVFKPPNPWTMAIMNVLAELHQEPDLKLNLKFEIEVLCKHLNIDVADLKAVVYLKDPEKIVNIEYQLSQPKQIIDSTPPSAIATPSQNIIPQEEPSTTPAPSSNHSMSPQNPSVDSAGVTAAPPEPKYNYMDITVHNYSCINQYLTVSPNISLLHTHPQLKQFIRTAIERTISDWINPVVERSVKIALTTSEQLVRKDFALDPDENRLRTASHFMIRNLTAGMAMITCRDQLMQTITTNVKTAFMTGLSGQHKELAEAAAAQIAADNMELACVFIQKTAMEKAVPEIDKRLLEESNTRKAARQEGRRHFDSNVLTYQNERMPEQIRLKVGGTSNAQFAVYEEFARNIPGFQQVSDRDAATFIPKATVPESAVPYTTPYTAMAQTHGTPFGSDEFPVLYEELGNKMETFISSAINVNALHAQLTNMHSLLDCLLVVRRTRDNLSAVNLLNKAVEGLMEGLVNLPEHVDQMKLYRDIHLRVMRLLQDNRAFGVPWTNKAITKYMMECRDEIRYNLEAVDLLISSNFVNIPQFDMMLSQSLDNGNNYVAIAFAMQLIQHYCIDERPNSVITENELFNTIELLVRIVQTQRAPEGLSHLIEMLKVTHDPNNYLMDRSNSGPTQHIHSGIVQVRANDIDDPPGLLDKTEYLLKDWVTIYYTQSTGRDPIKAFGTFVNKMNIYGILKTDDLITRFFRQATQICIDLVYRHLNDPNIVMAIANQKYFSTLMLLSD